MSQSQDERQVWSELRASVARTLGDAAPCPPAGRLLELRQGTLEPDARRALARHLAGCAACREDLEVLRETAPLTLEMSQAAAEALGGRAREEEAAAPRAGVPLQRWLLLAASLLVAAGLSLALWPETQRPPAGSVRRSDHERGVEATAPPDGAVLAQAPRELRWKPPPGAANGVVSVLDADGSLLWESPPVQGSSVELPASLVQRLDAGGRFHWQVGVELDSGRHASPFFGFTVTR